MEVDKEMWTGEDEDEGEYSKTYQAKVLKLGQHGKGQQNQIQFQIQM